MADGISIPSAALESIGTIRVKLGAMTEVGSGPKGTRVIVDVTSLEVASDKVKATLATNDAALGIEIPSAITSFLTNLDDRDNSGLFFNFKVVTNLR